MNPDHTHLDPMPEPVIVGPAADAEQAIIDLVQQHHLELYEFAQTVVELKLQEALVLVQKQLDYGPGNIGNPPANITPETALIVRINDKLQRIGNLEGSGRDAQNEALADSWLDVANYGTIGAMVLAGRWPGLSAR